MRKLRWWKALMFIGAASVTWFLLPAPPAAWAANPQGELVLLLRINGSPAFIGHTAPKGDGGTVGRVDAGMGNIVKTQCYAAACVCPGITCSCGNIAAGNGLATNGELLPANGVNYTILTWNNGMVSTAAAPSSVLLDGGVGAECDHWVL